MRKITVFTNYRCASTWFTDTLAQIHKLENLGEWFHHGAPKIKNLSNLNYLQQQDDWVLKIMPNQYGAIDGLADTLVELSDSVFYLLRKDFNSQVTSWYISSLTNDFRNSWQDTRQLPNKPDLWHLREQQLQDYTLELESVWRKHGSARELIWAEDILVRPCPVERAVEFEGKLPTSEFDPTQLFLTR